MAGELLLTASMQANKGGANGTLLNVARSMTALAQDIAGTHYDQGIQDFTTSPVAIEIGAVATTGYVFLRNTDATNNLLVRVGSGGTDTVRVRPGGIALFEAAGALFGSSSAGTISVEKLVFEL